jgi:hypothetical protein
MPSGKPEFRGPLNQDGDVVPDAAVSEQAVFVGNHVLDDGALHGRESLGEPVHHGRHSLGFRFLCHCRS